MIYNRPLAAKPSRDLLFIKLWAATLRMPEMEKESHGNRCSTVANNEKMKDGNAAIMP